MTPLFQRAAEPGKDNTKRRSSPGQRVPRPSSGWAKILSYLKDSPGLRVLDVGPTSPNNINFLTSLGHSVYMADLVEEAIKPEWVVPAKDDEGPRYNVAGFLARHMDFGDRKFDVVLLWDTLDYIPAPLADAVLGRLPEVLSEHAQTLAFFHSKMSGPETVFCRYHITDGNILHTQEGTNHPVLRNYQNRQIENLLQNLGFSRFYLAKDNTREVVVSR